MRVKYSYRNTESFVNRKPGESSVQAVTRALGRKLGPVTTWWSREENGVDVFTCKWFDQSTEIFEECEVFIPGPRAEERS